MHARRGCALLVVVAIVTTACTGTDEPSAATAATAGATTAARNDASTIPPDPGPEVDLRAIFEANGITVIDDPGQVDTVTGFQLWSFQVVNMEREILDRSGIFGFEIDKAAGAPSGMPMSYLVAGWITSAGTPAAAAAAEIMGDQSWQYAPSLVFPNAVLVLFVADSLLAQGAIGSDAASVRTVRAGGPRYDVSVGSDAALVAAQTGLCTRLSNWFNGVLDWIFEGLKFESISDAWYGWAQRVWNGAVDLARGVVETGIDVVSEVVLAPVRKALAVVGTVSMVVTHLQPWTADIRPARSTTELAVRGEPDVVEVASVFVSTGIRDPWPDLVKDCASVAGLELPDPTATAGSKVEWDLVDAFPRNRASIREADDEVGTNNHAVMKWSPGRDEGDAPFPGWINLAVTVEKNQVDTLQEMLIDFFIGAVIPAGEFAGRVEQIVRTLTEPVLEALLEILEVTDRQRITVIHHEDIDFDYPVDDLETYEDDGPGDGLIRVDVERAARTIGNVMSGGRIDTGPITGHAEFTVWLSPSDPACQIQYGTSFDSNPGDCTLTVMDGPEFLVGAVLSTADINGTRYYEWVGTAPAEPMLVFIGMPQPRCLDLSWYFRIFDSGVVIGYPKGLTQEHLIDQSGPDCVVLSTSTATEYTTTP